MSFSLLNIGNLGLDSQSQRISAIGNNIANLQTLGYKRDQVTFAEEFVTQIGVFENGITRFHGNGVKVAETSSDWSQGAVEETAVLSHIAIRGDGFIPVNYNGNDVLTRVGDFAVVEDAGNPGTYILQRPNGGHSARFNYRK